ncbi:ATP-binding protein [Amycolatopsis sp. NPDC004625]|uniref:sensor histidine kinase n=1 Tax=Amycolatopsis sp. NPDC004625 TaxID=3154670 RepID=UPI0033A85414
MTDSVQRAERVLVRAVVLFRLAGLVQIAFAIVTVHDHYEHPSGTVLLAATVTAESAAFASVCLRRGTIPAGWLWADLGFCVAALTAGAWLSRPADGHTWVHFMYPFTIVMAVGIGIGLRQLSLVVFATVVLAGGYGLSAMLLHRDPVWNVLPNAISYFANTLVAWAVTRVMLRTAHELDLSRAGEVAHAGALAAEQQRSYYSRLLHDHALQTLETLSRSDLIPDEEFHGHVAAEAGWLRAFVETGEPPQPGDLYSDLVEVLRRQARSGLRVELNATILTVRPHLRTALPTAVRSAVVGATHEALTNVAKHAGIDEAFLRVAAVPDSLVVTVLDHGHGFDPGSHTCGRGLEHSIRRRITEAGGDVTVESAPGSGTCVKLTVPLSPTA